MLFFDLQYSGCKKSCEVCGGRAAPAVVSMSDGYAAEAIERDPARYVRDLPEGLTLGPHDVSNRVIIS